MIKTHKTRPCRRLSQVRNELVRVAGAAQDMAPEAEQAWWKGNFKATVGTWKWGDVTPINSK